MRIISQDGTLDVPYEQISIEIKENEIWCGYYATLAQHLIAKKFATYSTEAKAKNAMEMLHRAYIGMPIIAVKDVDMDVKEISDAIRNGFVQPMPLNEPKIECDIFKFPADEDVEV